MPTESAPGMDLPGLWYGYAGGMLRIIGILVLYAWYRIGCVGISAIDTKMMHNLVPGGIEFDSNVG